ncbi:uncharacterized protein LOC134582537 [Pelobates fuscus]|uniref:uncharacterized protein LOC134582537 n=1 Tax=Pelobates fuscus TaxID=191477 RepID=UPI002FE4B67B
MSAQRRPPRGEPGEGSVTCESERHQDFVDRLACKYMRKCKVKVELSTDSESDNEIFGPGPTSTPNHGSSWRKRSTKLQFLDPYDGDSEEASTHSDSAVYSRCLPKRGKKSLLKNTVDPKYQEGTVLVPDHIPPPSEQKNSPALESSDICMKSLTDSETSLQTSEKLCDNSKSVQDLIETSMDSRAAPENRRSNSGHFLLIGVDSRTANHSGTVTSPRFQGNLPPTEENVDCSMSPISLAKRKLGLKMDYNNDKHRRKKARVTDTMVHFQSPSQISTIFRFQHNS